MLGSPHCLTQHCRLSLLPLVLYLREGNPLEDIWEMMQGARTVGNEQFVQDLLNMWHPYVLFEDIFGALATGAGTPAQVIANLKKVIITGMVREAKSRLAIKIDREGWQGGIDQIWVDLVAGAPKRQCGWDCQIHAPSVWLSTKMMMYG